MYLIFYCFVNTIMTHHFSIIHHHYPNQEMVEFGPYHHRKTQLERTPQPIKKKYNNLYHDLDDLQNYP